MIEQIQVNNAGLGVGVGSFNSKRHVIKQRQVKQYVVRGRGRQFQQKETCDKTKTS